MKFIAGVSGLCSRALKMIGLGSLAVRKPDLDVFTSDLDSVF